MARSMAPDSIPTFMSNAPARRVSMRTPGACSAHSCASTGMKYTSPTSLMAMVKVRVEVAASKCVRWPKARCSMSSAIATGSASCSARAVGIMPRGVRTNSSSSKVWRRRASALLTAGCDRPSRCATAAMRFSRRISWKTTSRFRSTSRRFSMPASTFTISMSFIFALIFQIYLRMRIIRRNKTRYTWRPAPPQETTMRATRHLCRLCSPGARCRRQGPLHRLPTPVPPRT
ncbi:hypothetical protein GO294_04225 [Ralstonia solanacearum]|nr:hypothetical protein [Ralstonia solanacearum]